MAAAMALQDGRRIVGASCYYLDWNWKWREHFERDVAHLMPTSRPSRRDMALLTGGEGQCTAVACIPAWFQSSPAVIVCFLFLLYLLSACLVAAQAQWRIGQSELTIAMRCVGFGRGPLPWWSGFGRIRDGL